jgi:Uma2 family endonuclease
MAILAPERTGVGLEQIEYIPMPLEQYLDTEWEGRVEWADGMAIVMPPTTFKHDTAQIRIASLADRVLSNVLIAINGGVMAGDNYRVPDVKVASAAVDSGDTVWSETALITVEVLSKSTFMTDSHRKLREYAAAGIPQYWIVNTDARTIEILQLQDGQYVPLAGISELHPDADIEVPGHGVIPVRWAEIFRE